MKYPKLYYTIFLLWILLISGLTIYTIYFLKDISYELVSIITYYFFLNEVLQGIELNPLLSASLEVLIIALLWWRVIKVLGLQGSPFPWFLNIMDGRENKGVSGRFVVCNYIGNINVTSVPSLYHGSIFMRHPNSDKLIRSRLELLMFALPYGFVLIIRDSKIYLKKFTQSQRISYFNSISFQYLRSSVSTSEDKYRSDVVKHLRTISNRFGKNVKRIDGLDWHFYYGGDGKIVDDFGYSIKFKLLENGKYRVFNLGPEGSESNVVSSIDSLRAIATRELHPVERLETD